MNNYEKKFSNIDKAVETLISLDEACSFCTYKGKECDGGCKNNIREFLEKEFKTKKVRNCDLYKTPEELQNAYHNHCKNNYCDNCKYEYPNDLNCKYRFAYDYTEIEDE